MNVKQWISNLDEVQDKIENSHVIVWRDTQLMLTEIDDFNESYQQPHLAMPQPMQHARNVVSSQINSVDNSYVDDSSNASNSNTNSNWNWNMIQLTPWVLGFSNSKSANSKNLIHRESINSLIQSSMNFHEHVESPIVFNESQQQNFDELDVGISTSPILPIMSWKVDENDEVQMSNQGPRIMGLIEFPVVNINSNVYQHLHQDQLGVVDVEPRNSSTSRIESRIDGRTSTRRDM